MGKSPEISLLTTAGPKKPEVPAVELSRPPEQLYKANFALLIISGAGSSGNTSLADGEAQLCGIDPANVFHAGEIFRQYSASENPETYDSFSVEYIDRPLTIDEMVDKEIERLIKSASAENPIIVEGKLGGAILRHLEQEAKDSGERLPAPRVAVLNFAGPKKRIEIAKAKQGTVTIKDLKRQTSERDAQDFEQWKKVHPWLNEFTNILKKNAKDSEGKDFYQAFVDVTDYDSIHGGLDDLNEKLLRLGLIEPIEHELTAGESTTIPSQVN